MLTYAQNANGNIIFFSNSKINILFILTFLVVIFAQRPRRGLPLTDLI